MIANLTLYFSFIIFCLVMVILIWQIVKNSKICQDLNFILMYTFSYNVQIILNNISCFIVSATCMLERKSFQEFREEWLKKFPITYKVYMYICIYLQPINALLIKCIIRTCYKDYMYVMLCAECMNLKHKPSISIPYIL